MLDVLETSPCSQEPAGLAGWAIKVRSIGMPMARGVRVRLSVAKNKTDLRYHI